VKALFKTPTLDAAGMIVDVTQLKGLLDEFDHINWNEHIGQPTMENMAKYLFEEIVDRVPVGALHSVTVYESEKAGVTYDETPSE
jgi:6-pyruvoyl-tetrahydropterin synthase